MPDPKRGEVWFGDPNPVRGHEQGGIRPFLVVSTDKLNSGPSQIVMVVPITSRDRGIATHIPIVPPEGGLKVRSYLLCEHLRAISRDRLTRRMGRISPETIALAAEQFRYLLEI